MSNATPPFSISASMTHSIANISEALGKISALYSPATIEHYKQQKPTSIQMKNSEFQFTASDLSSPDCLLALHRSLMKNKTEKSGCYREQSLALKNGLQMAPQAMRVPQMVEELFAWFNTTNHHPLISSAVCHYELQFIQPVSLGNTELACTWQTQQLSQWHTLFSLLNIHNLIATTRQQYVESINLSTKTGDSSVFIEYMLETLLSALNVLESDLKSITKSQTPQQTPQVKNTIHLDIQAPQVIALINVFNQSEKPLNRQELQNQLGLKDRKHFRERYLKPAIDAGIIEMTIPEKPNSKMQQYKLKS